MLALPGDVWRAIRSGLLVAVVIGHAHAESDSRLTGRVVDPSDRAVPRAEVVVRNLATHVERTVTTNSDGIYEIPALPAGSYRMQVKAPGFRLLTLEALTAQVARTLVEDVRLQLGDISQQVTVQSQAPLIDRASASVGHVIDRHTVQEIPLNGRYLLDLALLAPGSVTASQTGFGTLPFRGLGTLAISTAGNREETVNYMINGITLNDPLYNAIDFQPSIATVREFKIDSSAFSAEYGQNSGAVVNVATRSGGSQFHGELFEFLRNDLLDARNFFRLTSNHPPPFKRNSFGASLGGPILKARTFFHFSYEGLRQLQEIELNSLVLSEAERASVRDPAIAKLLTLIPRPNFVDSSGTPRYIGSAAAPVYADQWAMDISHILNKSGQLHGYYSIYRTESTEPTGRGNTTIPGFGYTQYPLRQFFSLSEVHTLGHHVNEIRGGLNRLASATYPNFQRNPEDFGIRDGISEPIGLPQISVAGNALNFGGPSNFPSGRSDTTLMAGDTLSCLCGRHSLKIGGEFRQYLNNNFRRGSGAFNFASVPAFLAGEANSFSVTLGRQTSSIAGRALGGFVQTTYRWRPNVTLDLGFRYEWNLTPHERYGLFTVFDPQSGSLVRLTRGDEIYHQNNRNFEPRLGVVWDPFRDGKTAVRGAYGVFVDQPITSVVVGTAGNPPVAVPLSFAGAIRLDNAIDLAQAAGLAPATVVRDFDNARLQSWNVNVQRELTPGLAAMAGYFGSKGTHLTLLRNLNQPVNGARPFVAVSSTSAVLPGRPLGNILQTESGGNSTYHALWISVAKPLSHGVLLNASYTWSKSLDYNSLSSQGIVVQDSYNLRGSRGLSDFDTRHRFAARAIYTLPFHGGRFAEGWQLAIVAQAQSGSPVNIVTSNSTFTGVANTLRPDVTGPIQILRNVDRWFDPSVFQPVSGFGSLGRNVVIGPGFSNLDLSLTKGLKICEKIEAQFRAEAFDLFNHANFGQPGNVAGGPGFGRITNTRFPTGESGSSRQLQLGLKLMF